MSRLVTVNVTAEQIAAAGDDRMEWAAPVEAAIAAIAGVEVSIDGDGEHGCVATIGTTDSATLVLDLPEEASDFLDYRWEGGGRGDPFTFDLDLPAWLVAFVETSR